MLIHGIYQEDFEATALKKSIGETLKSINLFKLHRTNFKAPYCNNNMIAAKVSMPSQRQFNFKFSFSAC
jgi:hypothetical protein